MPNGGNNIPDVLDSELLLRQTRNANAFEETVERLLQTIRLGLIEPGAKLPAERMLSGMLNVSRDTLREAIAALSETGYVTARRGRYGGTFVSETIPQSTFSHKNPSENSGVHPSHAQSTNLEEILTLRRILEIGAARESAKQNLSSTDRERLITAGNQCHNAGPENYRRFDSRLHLVIAELAGSEKLVPLIAESRMRINELLDQIPLLSRNISHSDEQHKNIVLAILGGQSELAAHNMGEHLAGSEALLRGFLN